LESALRSLRSMIIGGDETGSILSLSSRSLILAHPISASLQ
jgi:hypothetical protein